MAANVALVASLAFGGTAAGLWTGAAGGGYGQPVADAAAALAALLWASFGLQALSRVGAALTKPASPLALSVRAARYAAAAAAMAALGGVLPGCSVVAFYQAGEADDALQQATLLTGFASMWALVWAAAAGLE